MAHLFISKRLGWGIRVGYITGPLHSSKRSDPHPIALVVGFLLGAWLLYLLLNH